MAIFEIINKKIDESFVQLFVVYGWRQKYFTLGLNRGSGPGEVILRDYCIDDPEVLGGWNQTHHIELVRVTPEELGINVWRGWPRKSGSDILAAGIAAGFRAIRQDVAIPLAISLALKASETKNPLLAGVMATKMASWPCMFPGGPFRPAVSYSSKPGGYLSGSFECCPSQEEGWFFAV